MKLAIDRGTTCVGNVADEAQDNGQPAPLPSVKQLPEKFNRSELQYKNKLSPKCRADTELIIHGAPLVSH